MALRAGPGPELLRQLLVVVAESRGPGTQNVLVVTHILHTVPGPGTSCLRTSSSETRRPRGGPATVGGGGRQAGPQEDSPGPQPAWKLLGSEVGCLDSGPAPLLNCCVVWGRQLHCVHLHLETGQRWPSPQRAPGMGHGRGCAADLSCCHQASSLVRLLTLFCADWSVRTAAACGLWSTVAVARSQGRGPSSGLCWVVGSLGWFLSLLPKCDLPSEKCSPPLTWWIFHSAPSHQLVSSQERERLVGSPPAPCCLHYPGVTTLQRGF